MAAGYVIYGHYSDSGECFYVGVGSNERPYMLCKSQRSTGWYEYLKQNCSSGNLRSKYKNALENYQNKGELPCR